MDDDWEYIVFEFSMNFSLESFRRYYQEQKKKAKDAKIDTDKLRQLGYTEEQIAKRTR